MAPRDLGQEAAGEKLGQQGRIDLVGLSVGVCDPADLLGVGDHDPADMRGEHLDEARGVARRLDHDGIVPGQRRAGEGLQPIAPHVDPARPGDHAGEQRHHLGEGAMVSSPMTRMAPPPPGSW
jgi:hypothetical protein